MDKPRTLRAALEGRKLRLLGRAIRRVPNGRVLDREADEGRTWDAHTGLFLRRHRG